MKTLFTTIFIMAIIGLQSCSPTLPLYSSEVDFINKESTGTITLKSNGFGKDMDDAITDAQISAFNILLFRGIPATELNVPLVENEKDAKSKNPEYFKNFFEQGNFRSFIMSSRQSSDLLKVKGGKSISIEVKINFNSLRKDLEQNNVIRKFGF